MADERTEDEKEAELDRRIIEVIAELTEYDKKGIGERIGELLDIRLKNEYFLSHALFEGVKADNISVENLKKLLNSGKDSVGDLVKLVQLLGGKPTDIKEVTVQHRDIDERLNYFARNN